MKFKLLAIITIGFTFLLNPMLKAEPIVYSGKKGTLTIYPDFAGSWPTHITQDNRYVVLSAQSGTFGLIYDLVKDTVYSTFSDVQIMACAENPNLLVGNIVPDGSVNEEVLGIHIRNNKRINLEGLLATTMGGGDVSGISADGKKMCATMLLNNTSTAIRAAIYDTNGKMVEILPIHHPQYPENNNDSRPYGMSYDGSIVYGWGSWPEHANRTPVYWVNGVAYTAYEKTPDEKLFEGEIYACNENINLLSGAVNKYGLLYYHHLTSPKRVLLDPLASFQKLSLQGVSNDTIAVGYLEREFGDREAYIYTPFHSGLLLKDYIKELYGIDMGFQDILQACLISSDSRTIIGYVYLSGEYSPFIIKLDAEHLLPAPKFLSGIQSKTTTEVGLKWSAPIKIEEDLIGYNVYIDGIAPQNKVNNNIVTSTNYTTAPLSTGSHVFYITSVYKTSGESDTCKSFSMRIIGSNDCLPIQTLSADVTYNSIVDLKWDLPSSNTKVGTAGAPTTGYDLIKYYNLNSQQYSLARKGDFYYMSSYQGFDILKLDLDFNRVGSVSIDGTTAIANFAFGPNNLLYAVSGHNNTVQVLNLETEEIQDNLIVNIDGLKEISHITYIPDGDNGKGALELGNFTKSYVVNFDGEKIGEGPSISNVLGSAYNNGLFYTFENNLDTACLLITYDWNSKTVLDRTNLLDNKTMQNVMSGGQTTDPNVAAAGSLCISTLSDGSTALACVAQGRYVLNHVFLFEVNNPEIILGYELYRNGEKVNNELLSRRAYRDILDETGSYTYNVRAINNNGCMSDTSENRVSVDIAPKGECAPVSSLSAIETDSNVLITFSVIDNGLLPVGFNIYRDGKLLEELYLSSKYLDINPGKGTHKYEIESFYESACTASDSITIMVDFEGSANPPSLLSLSSKKDSNQVTNTVNAKWNMPFFDSITSELRFGIGATGYSFALPMVTEYTALIGWDSAKLENYKDLVLVGMQVFMTDEVKEFSSVVILNNKVVYNNPEGRIKVGSDQNIFFNEVFPMNQPTSVEVGYSISFEQGKQPSGLDIAPAVSGYGDIFTLDMSDFGYLKSDAGTNNNWSIAGLATRYRDLEAAGKNWKTNEDFLKSLKPIKTTSTAHKLIGFNIYRNNQKINSSLLTKPEFTDLMVSSDEHEYSVSAVYASGEEKFGPISFIDLTHTSNDDLQKNHGISFYPNPAKTQITVNGDFSSIRILDVQGKLLKKFQDKASVYSLSGLKSGSYIIQFTLTDGRTSNQKLIIQ